MMVKRVYVENCLDQVVPGVSGGAILIKVVEVGRPSHCGWSISWTEDPKLDNGEGNFVVLREHDLPTSQLETMST